MVQGACEDFQKLKALISAAQILTAFNPELETPLLRWHWHCPHPYPPGDKLRLIQFAGRGLTEAERNYGVTETEALAIV